MWSLAVVLAIGFVLMRKQNAKLDGIEVTIMRRDFLKLGASGVRGEIHREFHA